jgi:hypothetical protein
VTRRRYTTRITRHNPTPTQDQVKGYIKINRWACVCAAHAGHLRVLKWLVEETDANQKWMEEHTPLAAAAGGHLCILQYVLQECRCPWWPRRTLEQCIAHRHPGCLKWLLKYVTLPVVIRSHSDKLPLAMETLAYLERELTNLL